MENKKVMIENCVNHEIGIVLPELGIRRTWERKGAKKSIDLSLLREAMYEPGVEYMFTSGMLYIDDLEVKKELGLEPEDATAPVNIVILTDAQKKRLLSTAPTAELKQYLKTANYEQIQDLAKYAVANEIIDYDKCEVLKEAAQIDIIRAIQLNRADKEPTPTSRK